jgi:glycosyltransferase involved in cell wall biosynthesis
MGKRPPGAPPEDILFFGFAAPFKGLGVLLEAFELLRARRPQATLTIAGTDHARFPGYLSTLTASVKARNGHGPKGIRWLGAQPEAQVRAIFARARVVVLPYTATTGASSVLYRAAGAGRPVIASALPDLRAAAEEQNLRIDFVPPADPIALASGLEVLLANPQCQARNVEHNLRAMRELTLERTCARYVDVFRQLAT